MANFHLKDSEEYYLELSDPVRFDAVSQRASVFFDDTNGQVFTVQSGGVTGVTVNGFNMPSKSFCMEDKGAVTSIKFSLDQKILAIQSQKTNIVDFLTFENGVKTNVEFSHSCKWKSAKILGFVWPKANEIAYITDHGIELLQILPEKKQLKSLKNVTFSAAWFSWCAYSKIVLLAGNNGALLQPFSLNNSTINKLQKLELEAGKPACDRDVFLLRVSNHTWCALLRHGAPGSVGPAEVALMCVSGVQQNHVLRTGLVGRFAINVIDDLIVVHHQASQTSLLFDIMEECKTENSSMVHIPVVIGKTLKPYVLDETPCAMYSGNWVVFQPDVIIDGRLGCLWRVTFKPLGLAHSIPRDEISKIVAVLLRRKHGLETIYKILNQLVENAGEYLVELSKVFDEINAVYRKWADLEVAKQTGHNANQHGDALMRNSQNSQNSGTVIKQPDIYTNVFQQHSDTKFIVQVLTSYVGSLCKYDMTVQHSIAELCATSLVRRGQCHRLRQTIRHGCLGDSRPLACLLLSLANLDPAAGQLALDMMWRLKAYEETVEVLLSCHDTVAAVGAAKQAGSQTWNSLPARKLLAAAKQQAEDNSDPGAFVAVYHALENRNRQSRGNPGFYKGEQCDTYVQHYQNLTSEPEQN